MALRTEAVQGQNHNRKIDKKIIVPPDGIALLKYQNRGKGVLFKILTLV